MSRYLLSVHTVEGDAARPPMTAEEMQAFMGRIQALEAEMKSSGSFLFGGRLHDPETATVVRRGAPELVMTDGPFVESKEHIGGFYIIDAPDLDAALAWAGKVVEAVGAPIEVWPFSDTSEP
ncbi:MAG: YciI family protein [Acidimicrobiales bacterium]